MAGMERSQKLMSTWLEVSNVKKVSFSMTGKGVVKKVSFSMAGKGHGQKLI
jgi:hypothetical protein